MDNEHLEQEQSISLGEIFALIKKNFFILAAATLLGGLILGVYAFKFASPKYKSTGAVIVQVSGDVNDPNKESVNTVESLRLIQTVMQIITDIDKVPNDAVQALKEKDINLSSAELKKNLSVSNKNNGLIISISYTSTDDNVSKEVVEAVITALLDFTESVEESEILIFKNNIYAFKDVPVGKQVAPNKLLLILVGLLLGGTVSLVFVITLEMINSGIKTKEELMAYTKVQVLGSIPEFRIKEEGNHKWKKDINF